MATKEHIVDNFSSITSFTKHNISIENIQSEHYAELLKTKSLCSFSRTFPMQPCTMQPFTGRSRESEEQRNFSEGMNDDTAVLTAVNHVIS